MIKSNPVFSRQLFIFMVLLLVASCGKKEVKELPPPPVQVIKVVQTTVPIPSDFTGQTYGYKDIPIRARVDGFLTGMYFQEGSAVKKGQLLYTIDPEPLKAVEATQLSLLAEAETQFAKAESDVKRYRPLAAINAVSQSDLDAAEAQYGAAKAAVDAAKAQLEYARINLSYATITSPIDGIIGRTEAKTGEYVGKYPNPIVLNTVSSVDSILVQFSIGESEFLNMLKGYKEKQKSMNENSSKKAKISLILADGSVYESPGRFNFADRQVDPATGTILMQVSFPNNGGILRPGQFARLRVIMDEVENGLIIPQRCVKEIQGVYQVMVANANNEVEPRQVKMGPKVGSMWMVLDGLKADEQIIFEGLMAAKPGNKVSPQLVEIPAEFMNFN
ncbi:MAG: efflux RND transporter periplasmic adaptor subunit [Bacteroidales bacterium]